MRTCPRCGIAGIVWNGLCGDCQRKKDLAAREKNREANAERQAREMAKLRHPAGRSAKQRARQLWIDLTRWERNGESEAWERKHAERDVS